MNRARHLIGFSGLLLGTALAGSPVGVFLDAADHLDAPTVRRDGRIDINDIYVFHPGGSPVDPQAAQNLSRTVLIMTVNPAAGLLSDTSFRPDALYEFVLDATGDARADRIVRVEFTGQGASQRLVVSLIDEPAEEDGRTLTEGSVGVTVNGESGVRVFAGLRDDPFFFDLAAFNAGGAFGMPGFGDDFFLGLDVSAIVIELPTERLDHRGRHYERFHRQRLGLSRRVSISGATEWVASDNRTAGDETEFSRCGGICGFSTGSLSVVR